MLAMKVLIGSPIGTQEDVLSLIASGGYDSGVSSYMLMRHAVVDVHYVFLILVVQPTKLALNKLHIIFGTAFGRGKSTFCCR